MGSARGFSRVAIAYISGSLNVVAIGPPAAYLSFLRPPPGSEICPVDIPGPHVIAAGIDHPDTFDYISCFMPRPNTEVWSINRPNVTSPVTAYPAIRFQKEDLVMFSAGGCAQRGGIGKTWNRYVEPLGGDRSSDNLHFGSAGVPGLFGATRLNDLIKSSPISVTSDLGPADNYLRLYYKDEGYTDNGYWGKDQGWHDQCWEMEDAWVVVIIEHGCAGSTAPNCPVAAPMDLVSFGTEANGLMLNPRWGWHVTTGVSAASSQTCNFSLRSEGMPEDDVSLCTRQTTTKNHDVLKCPWADKGGPIGTRGRIGGHVNWRPATYTGLITKWGGRTSDDDDYQIYMKATGGAGEIQDGGIELEFDSDEVIDPHGVLNERDGKLVGRDFPGVQSSWWKSFRDAVDGKKSERNPHVIENREVRVIGELGIDCAHSCSSELHPVYLLAIHIQSDPNDDVWAVIARNWGTEGYCGPDNVPLAVPLNRVQVSLPTPGEQWSGFEVLDSTELRLSYSDSAMAYSILSPPGAANVVFTLLAPSEQSQIDGVIHLRWKK